MTSVSISQLKINPSEAISFASDYPVAIENRNKTKAYLVGKDLFEKLITYIEDYIDRKEIEKTDFRKGKDFEIIAKQLGI
jgi:PHD/YefM family antitoxin component YafN of YafNO toxin-antitoxin module